MRFLSFLIKWQFWATILSMALLFCGIVYFVYAIWLNSYTNFGEEITMPDLSKHDVYTAMTMLEEEGLRYEIDSSKFDSLKPKHSILEFYPKAGYRVKEGRKIFIKSNPSDHPPVPLPNLIDNPKKLAFSKLRIAKINVKDTLYEPDVAKDVVLRVLYKGKEIKPGTRLPRFSKIDIVLGGGLLEEVPIPSFMNYALMDAKYALKANYFEVGNIQFVGPRDSLKAKVFYQLPQPGELYDQGSPVDLWVSVYPKDSLQNKISELNDLYRRDENDSLYFEMLKERANMSAKNLPEDVRHAVEEVKTNSGNKPREAPVEPPKNTAPPREIEVEVN